MRSRLLSLGFAGFSWLILNPVARAQNDMMPNHSTESYVYTNDDLGAVYHPEATSVKLWAPTAKQVRLLLFNGATNESFRTIPMSRIRTAFGRPTWRATWMADIICMKSRFCRRDRDADGLSCQRSLRPRLFGQLRPDVDL